MTEAVVNFGLVAERWFQDAFSSAESLPEWFLGVRPATKQEDANGIDAIVTLDVGEELFQIKTSMQGVLRYQRKRPESRCIIILIQRYATLEQIRTAVLELLHSRRERALKART